MIQIIVRGQDEKKNTHIANLIRHFLESQDHVTGIKVTRSRKFNKNIAKWPDYGLYASEVFITTEEEPKAQNSEQISD